MLKSSTKGQNKDDDVPHLLYPLLSVYRMVPTFHLPGITNFNFAFCVLSTIFLSMMRTIAWELLLAAGWPARSKMTTDSASSLGSICHSLILVYFLGILLFKLPKGGYVPSAKMDSFPKWWQEAASALLEFCTGYMIFDTIFLIRDTRNLGMELSEFDMLVLGHHFLTSCYMISTRVVNAGHLSAMSLMFGGEITNPFMNGMFTTRFAIQLDCCKSDQVLLLHTILEHSFAFSYLFIRGVLGPFIALHLTWDLLAKEGRQRVPIQLSLVWVTMVWVVFLGSMSFVFEALDMLKDGWELLYHENYDFGERYMIRDEL